MFIRWTKLLSPIFLFISFFLPWFSFLGLSASGLQASIAIPQLSAVFSAIDITATIPNGTKILLYSLWLIPIFSVLSVMLLFLDKSVKWVNIPLSIYSIGLFIYFWAQLKFGLMLFHVVGAGFYMLVAFSILLLIATFTDREDYLYEQ